MVDPVAMDHIMLAALAGALVIIFGGLYALLFAFGKIRKAPRLLFGAYVSYLCLFVATLALAEFLNLDGTWQVVVIVMVIGYLLAPQAIWHLCVATHAENKEPGSDVAGHQI